jgi:hypothetical protein
VKLRRYRGHTLSFHLSPQLMVNRLQSQPGAIGPIAMVAANEPVIETACPHAIARFRHTATTIELQREDFVSAA